MITEEKDIPTTLATDGALHCECVKGAGTDIVYILMPMDLPRSVYEAFAKEYGCSVVAVTGIDWDNDLTPWPEPGVFKTDAPFAGKAAEFLDLLRTRLMPACEQKLNEVTDTTTPTAFNRFLAGISLSGLFAVWAWMQGNDFNGIISISGSFWYNGFVDWLKAHSIAKTGQKAFLCLGDKEGATHVKRFKGIDTYTSEVAEILRGTGAEVTYTMVPGTHYADPTPRLQAAFTALFKH